MTLLSQFYKLDHLDLRVKEKNFYDSTFNENSYKRKTNSLIQFFFPIILLNNNEINAYKTLFIFKKRFCRNMMKKQNYRQRYKLLLHFLVLFSTFFLNLNLPGI